MVDLGLWGIERMSRESVKQEANRLLGEVLADLDILEVGDNYVVTARRFAHPLVDTEATPQLQEIGTTGTRWRQVLGGSEYNPELRGRSGLRNFERMRKSDGTVAQALKIAKTPVLQAEWWVDPYDPDDPVAVQQAEFIHNALFEWQSIGWTQWLTEALTMLDFGYSFFEKVFTYHNWQNRRMVIWRKFAPRNVGDVEEWLFDDHGGPSGVRMIGDDGVPNVTIPIEKLLIFSYRREGGNVEGVSALREMYKHWYYKENLYKIDAIQKERHGIGIPVIKLPPNFSQRDKSLADELGRNLRTNEWAHITLPPFWEVEFAEVRGQSVDVMSSIQHHDAKILATVMGMFGIETDKADAEVQMDLYMKFSRHIADVIREVINKYAIPELIAFNWMNYEGLPQLRVRHIGQVADLRTMSFTIRNLIGAKALVPDDKLEDYLRYVNDLPRRDPSTAREVETPQMPGEEEEAEAGPPRQSQAGQQRLQPGRNEGEDDSGG